MLKSLNIKNYAIIDDLNIDFEKGFNAFTGETGAGKSIIVGALTFLIKGKADPSVIKTGEDKAIIEGIFDIEDYMKDILDEADIEYDDELIVRRVISRDNKNSIKINMCTVTLQFLTELLSNHIDVHSQKDSQFLLNKKNHQLLLDRYCNNHSELREYQDKYNKYTKLLNEYNDLLNNTYNESDIEYIKYDLKELEDANLKTDEEIDLSNKEKRYKDSEKYINSLNTAISIYEDDNSIKDRLNTLIKSLNIDDDSIGEIQKNIEDSYYSLNDDVSKLKDILYSLTDSDLNIEFIEERLYLYSKLKRKHGLDVEGLIKLKDELKQKIQFFEDKDTVLNDKINEVNKAKNDCLQIANSLHEIRLEKALQLEKDIVNQCEDLMLNNVRFKVNINQTDLNMNGIDDIEFYISLNKGEDLKPLKNVASGGEISRLMLALKTIFTRLSECSLVIFDEIDTGVSGKVALAMGKKMKTISKDVQTLSITHLAPVAACADNHFYIYKTDNSNTRVRKLSTEERIDELANISSTEKTDSSILAAKELFKLGQE